MWIKIILVTFVVLVVGIMIFLKIPYSKVKSDFYKAVTEQMNKTKAIDEVFTADDLKELPLPVKRYFEYCGYIGTPKMSYMKADFKDVDFVLSPDKPKIKIDYPLYIFVEKPARLALVDTTMYGIPFQGGDSFVDGVGSMKGVLAKTITLFNETGKEMDKGSLLTILGESLLIPNVILQDYVTWEAIDDTRAKATIAYYGISASGEFTFSEKGELLSFTTDERTNVGIDGSSQQVPWSIVFGDYKTIDGIKQPTTVQVIWHYESGDLIYFESDNFTVEYH